MMKLWSKFLSCTKGNFTVATALLSLPLSLGAGIAVDYARISDTRTKVQGALDAAVLASAAKGTLDTAHSSKLFNRNVPNSPGLTINSVAFTADNTGVLTAKAQVSMPMGMLGMFGKTRQTIRVSSKAQMFQIMKISQVTFEITSASGAYDKDFYFFTKDSTGKITSEQLVMSYDYTLSSTGKQTRVYTPALTSAKTAAVGDYSTVGVKMVVYEDTTYRGVKTNPKSYLSDDPKAANWTRTTGACTDGSGQTNNWEDGGDANFKDFVFNLKCTVATSGKTMARLTD